MNIKQAAAMLGVSDAKQVHILSALIQTYPEIKTSNWKASALKSFANREDAESVASVINDVDLLPDGFVIDDDEDGLLFFEVEVHSPMSGDKLRKYGKLAIDLACYEINFSLLTVNKYGHINKVDLLPYYADWLKRSVQ